MYDNDFKGYFNEVVYDVIANMVNNQVPFRLVLSTDDDWDKPLPKEVLTNKVLVLDINDQTLEDTYFDDTEKLIRITTGFNGEAYTKLIMTHQVVAVLDITTGQPIVLKPYKNEKPSPTTEQVDEVLGDRPKFKNAIEIIESLMEDGIEKEGAVKSVTALLSNNPQYAEKYKFEV